MRLAGLAALAVLAACPKPQPTPSEVPTQTMDRPDVEEREVPVPVAPGAWRGGGISVWVDQEWTGEHTQGPPETLAMRDLQTGTELRVELGPTELALPRGCEPLFEDAGSYRSVPLSEQRTASCVEDSGALLTVWTGRVEYVAVRIEARFPLGAAVKGRQRVEAILSTISAAGGG